jgi:hypothetical protein
LYRAFAALAKKIKLSESMQSESNSQSQREAELQAVKRWLEVLRQNWLLILDNADNLNIEPGLTHFIPSGKYGHVIVTSRDPLSRALGSGIDVGDMTKDDAMALLFRCSGKEAMSEYQLDANLIVQKLGNLALAIDQAGAFIMAQQISFKAFLQQYDRSCQNFLSYNVPSSLRRYRNSVITTLEISLNHIEESCPSAVQLLYSFAVGQIGYYLTFLPCRRRVANDNHNI